MATMNRRRFLRTAAVAGAGGYLAWSGRAIAGSETGLTDTSRMNILFFDNEDFTAEAIGCYGNPIVKTPNLDRLAASGIRFDRAYCQAPCCNPSRTSFCTGLRPETTGVYGNGDAMNEHLPDWAVSLAELLETKDVDTANVGKLYHRTSWAEKQLRAFDRLEFCQPPTGYKGVAKGYTIPPDTPPNPGHFMYSPDPEVEKQLRARRKELAEKAKGLPPTQRWKVMRRLGWEISRRLVGDSGKVEQREGDGRKARLAARMLQEFAASGKQFFLALGFSRPHTPLIAPKKYVDMYDPADMPPPKAPPEEDRGIPKFAKGVADVDPEHGAAKLIASYYACASFIDAQVGLVLDALEQAGLARNTIVIFFGDHGFHLGEHGCWSKYTLFEQVTRVPLIVRVPGAVGSGAVCRRIVELVDLLPTLADFWNIPVPERVEGTSFAPLVADPARSWKKAAFTAHHTGKARSVRTERYRYTEWQRNSAVELYDLQKDPLEQVNRADDPALAGVRAEHARLLKQGWKAVLPPSA